MSSTNGPTFVRRAWSEVDWSALDRYADRNVFQTRAWLEFLAEIQRAEPVIAALEDGGEHLGYFSGLLVKRWGLRFLGSPLPGWTTPYLGFNLDPDVPRRVAAAALVEFAFKELRCAHLELRDRRLTADDTDGLGFGRRQDVGYDDRTFEIDLSQSEDAIFGGMTSACRRCIRKAEKSGVTIEEATDAAFAGEFHDQLREVFVRQGLVPTYGVERVETLIRHLQPAGMLLLLRARDAEGRCIATGIYPAFGEMMFFWGGASLREHQHLRPNEALHWHAMRYWKQRGMTRYDLGGFMDYKEKYGGAEVAVPGFRRSRHAWVSVARTAAPAGMRAKQTIVGGTSRGFRVAVDWLGHPRLRTGPANG
jgi:CelD/BcsL family acetyltransferase involved in cellulose biosynthesis